MAVLWLPYLASFAGAPWVALDSRRWSLLVQTALYSATVGLLVALLGFGSAAYIWGRWGRVGPVALWLGLSLAAIPPTVHAGAWLGLGLGLKGWPLAVAVQAAGWLPFGTAMVLAHLKAVPDDVLDAARVFMPPVRQWRNVLLPALVPSLVAVASLAALASSADMTVPSLVGRNTYASEVFVLFGGGSGGAGSAWPLLLFALPLTILAAGSVRRLAGSSARKGVARPLVSHPGLLLPAGVVAAAIAVPLVSLTLQTGGFAGLAIGVGRAWQDVFPTLAVAFAGSALALVAGVPLGLRMVASKTGVWWWMVLAPLGLPTALLGVGASRLVGSVADGPWALVWALAARCIPLTSVVVAAAFLRTDRDAWDAGRIGMSLRRFWPKVGLPMLGPGLGLALGLGAAWNVGEVAATLPAIEPGQGSLAIRIYNNLHYGASQDVAAQALLLCAVVFVGALPMLWRPKWTR